MFTFLVKTPSRQTYLLVRASATERPCRTFLDRSTHDKIFTVLLLRDANLSA